MRKVTVPCPLPSGVGVSKVSQVYETCEMCNGVKYYDYVFGGTMGSSGSL